MILFVNACARPESRTYALAQKALSYLPGEATQLNLYEEDLKPLTYEDLTKRDEGIGRGDYSGEIFRYAREFREADEIVIAAPYWDLAFPSVLKCYVETLCVNGLTFFYNEQGIPESLCRAKKLIYVTTAGGPIPEENFGYDYIKAVCTGFFGVGECVCFKAEGLDIFGADVSGILKAAEEKIAETLG